MLCLDLPLSEGYLEGKGGLYGGFVLGCVVQLPLVIVCAIPVSLKLVDLAGRVVHELPDYP